MTRAEFIDKAWKAALQARLRGAQISVPIVVAQAALETGYNTSQLSQNHNNLFGIKGDYQGKFAELPTREQDDAGNWITIKAKFRSYPSWVECFEDYGDLIARLPWYQDAEDAAHSPKDFLKGLLTIRNEHGQVLEPGWATDRHYAEKVWSIVERHNLLERQEVQKSDEFALIQIFDDDRMYTFSPLKVTPGTTRNGEQKLMIRVKPTSFLQRLRFLLPNPKRG